MKKIILVALILTSLISTAGNEIRPFRIGMKFGWPNMIGFNTEYVTPLLNNRVAPFADFSYIGGFASDGTNTSAGGIRYFEIGANIYALETGKYAYLGLSYGSLALIGYASTGTETSEGKVSMNMFNIKIGAKLGNSFYFRPEFGYALSGGIKTEGNVTTNQAKLGGTVDLSATTSMLIFNLGFGVAF